ncbi:MAG: hypothetical protein AAF657_08205 [Acidobacteriota bacterium]
MMRFAYLVSAGVCLSALAPLFAQSQTTTQLAVDPWQGTVEWSEAEGTLSVVEAPVHGAALIRQDGTLVYTPTLGGDFWTVGSDRLTVSEDLDGVVTTHRLALRASSPTVGPPTTHFEGEPLPTEVDINEQLWFGAAGALLGEGGMRIALDGTGTEAYLHYSVEESYLGDPNNTDAGCADLRMGLGDRGIRLPDAACEAEEGGFQVCVLTLLSARATSGGERFRIEAGLSSTETLLRGVAFDSEGARHASAWIPVTDNQHEIRLDWWTGEDGGMRLRIDERTRAEIRGVASLGLEVDEVRIGAPINPPGASFNLKMDAITVREGPVAHDYEELTADPFESDLSAWETMGTSRGDITVTPAAAITGLAGLELDLQPGSDWGSWILDRQPSGDRSAGVRFLVDATYLEMGLGETMALVLAHPEDYGPSVASRFLVRLWDSPTGLRIRASAHDDQGGRHDLPYASLPDGPHRVELTWRAASEVDRYDGRLRLWLDGTLIGELTDLDNDTAVIESIRFGAMYVQDGTHDILYLDDFESWQ